MSESPRASVLIPTLNAEADLARLLPALAAQELPGGFELIAIDSNSRDRTRELLGQAGARVERIDRADFRHGPTRNRLAGLARSPLVVFLSQDALPVRPDCLARLLEPFEDPLVAGTTGRVLPHEGDDPLTARSVLAAPEASATPRRMLAPAQGLEALAPAEQLALCRFNDVLSAMRAEVLARIPLPDLPFGEDVAWAREVLGAGLALEYVPSALVHHSHRYSPLSAFERFRVDAAFQRREFGLRPRPDLSAWLRGSLYELREDWRYLARGKHSRAHWLRALALRPAQVLGQLFGSRAWHLPGGSSATRRYH